MYRQVMMALVLIVMCIPGICLAAGEFDNSDIFPRMLKIDFTKDYVFFYSREYMGGNQWYAMARGNHQFRPISNSPEIDRVNGLVIYPPAVLHVTKGNGNMELATSRGDTYISFTPYCEERSEGSGWIDHGYVELRSHLGQCRGAGAIEEFDGKLLIGSRAAWEGGVGATAPVIVIDKKTQRLLEKITFPATVIRADPFLQQVWMAGPNGIAIADRDLKIIKRWYFYVGFEQTDHKPAVLLADQPTKTDALAEVARELNIQDTAGWYKAVQSIPEPVRATYSLYEFNMQATAYMGVPVAKDFNVLVPLFINVIREKDNNGVKPLAIYNLCRFKDPEVLPFLEQLRRGRSDNYRDYKNIKDYYITNEIDECLSALRARNEHPRVRSQAP